MGSGWHRNCADSQRRSAKLCHFRVTQFDVRQRHEHWLVQLPSRAFDADARLLLLSTSIVYSVGDARRRFLGLILDRLEVDGRTRAACNCHVADHDYAVARNQLEPAAGQLRKVHRYLVGI